MGVCRWAELALLGVKVHLVMNVVGRELLREGSSRVLSAVAAAGRGRRGAGMFSGRVNAVTGRQEWVAEQRDAESEEGDLSPELARSQYGDMLHDTARVWIITE